MQASSWLLDTNILLRFFGPTRRPNPEIDLAVESLVGRVAGLYYTSQLLAEFWNVSTRPEAANGLGRSLAETIAAVESIEEAMSLAPDSEAVHHEWRRLVVTNRVLGAQVHDARIIATMRVNNIHHLLTFNVKDFRRYGGVVAMTPRELLR